MTLKSSPPLNISSRIARYTQHVKKIKTHPLLARPCIPHMPLPLADFDAIMQLQYLGFVIECEGVLALYENNNELRFNTINRSCCNI